MDRYKRLVLQIESLNKTASEELFKILYRNDSFFYTANNNGVFINMTRLPEAQIEQIENYIKFYSHSSTNLINRDIELSKILTITEELEEIDIVPKKTTVEEDVIITHTDDKPVSKMTSSMRFYLLKKRFSKAPPTFSPSENDLEVEEYLL